MSKLLVLIFIFCFIAIFIFLIYIKKYKQSKELISFLNLKPTQTEQENNPYTNTNDWRLHKNRLIKFGRSQYKGLTFFVSSENRIYYLSEEGIKIYC